MPGRAEVLLKTRLAADAHHTADRYAWDLSGRAGNPKTREHRATVHPGTSDSGRFVNPDNLTFDPKGGMFVASDGATDFDIADGICAVDTEGPARGLPNLLFARPKGAEARGGRSSCRTARRCSPRSSTRRRMPRRRRR